MALSTVISGQTIEAEHHNSIVGLLKGTTSYGDNIALTQYNSSSTYALDVRNLDTSSSPGLRVRDGSDNDLLNVTASGVSVNGLTITPLNKTIGAETPIVTFGGATYTGGTAIATQRFFRFRRPTLAFTAAQTTTTAATLAIEGTPVAGTNATITNAYALLVEAGTARFEGAVQAAGGLTVTGAISSTGALTVPDGTVAAPGLRTTTEASGLYRYSATELGLSAAGTAAGRFSATAANLPGTLSVGGALTVTTGGLTVSAGGVTITGNSTVTGTLTATSTLTVSAGGAAVTGNSTITGTLTVADGTAAAPGLRLTTDASGLYRYASGELGLAAGGAYAARFSSAAANLPGSLTVANGLTVSASGLTVSAGGIGVTAGNLTLTSGNLTLSAGRVSIAQGTITTDQKALLITSTWNNAAENFSALQVDVTDTASSATSNIFNLKIAGTEVCVVTKTGALVAFNAATVGKSTSTFGTLLQLNAQGINNYLLLATVNAVNVFGVTGDGKLLFGTSANLRQTTVGAAGAAAALPANPLGYLRITINGGEAVIPYYNQA